MRHYCTYFDANYLTRGLALHGSLVRHGGDFELVVLCMDDAAAADLRRRALPRIRLLPLADLVAAYPALAAARGNRTNLEFYFTCTSWLMRHLLPQVPAGELLTYLDADLYFFAPPAAVYEEIGAASVAITPHLDYEPRTSSAAQTVNGSGAPFISPTGTIRQSTVFKLRVSQLTQPLYRSITFPLPFLTSPITYTRSPSFCSCCLIESANAGRTTSV